jgi:hypothetical protein
LARGTQNRIFELHESTNQKITTAHGRDIKLAFKDSKFATNWRVSPNNLSPALKAVLLMFVLLNAAQPAQTKSPEISVRAVLGLLGAHIE